MTVMTEQSDELREEIDKEITKAYIGGLVDGTATITVQISKSSDYKLGYNLEPVLRISKKRPHSIQMVDDWAAKNGIFVTIREEEDRFMLNINRNRDLTRFLEEMYPYVQDKREIFELMLEDILPALQRGDHLSDEEGFVSVVEDIDYLKEIREGRTASKYDAEFFREEWDLD